MDRVEDSMYLDKIRFSVVYLASHMKEALHDIYMGFIQFNRNVRVDGFVQLELACGWIR